MAAQPSVWCGSSPAGAAMDEHDHGGSDVVLITQMGSVEISSARAHRSFMRPSATQP